eukprot:jgi/Chlat1/2611/Chrsp178S02463
MVSVVSRSPQIADKHSWQPPCAAALMPPLPPFPPCTFSYSLPPPYAAICSQLASNAFAFAKDRGHKRPSDLIGTGTVQATQQLVQVTPTGESAATAGASIEDNVFVGYSAAAMPVPSTASITGIAAAEPLWPTHQNNMCDIQSSSMHEFNALCPTTPRVQGDRPNSQDPDTEPMLRPLGLQLKKSASLVDLVNRRLRGTDVDATEPPPSDSQDKCAEQPYRAVAVPSLALAPTTRPAPRILEAISESTVVSASVQSAVEFKCDSKMKASNFPATLLQIGSWQRISCHEGDLVGKFYYAKRKVVWELLEGTLKRKLEMQWSDLRVFKVDMPEDQPGMIELELARPPLFFKETNPQPRKHTLWQTTTDFTGGQATVNMRHVLQFPAGVLHKHYKKIMSVDERIRGLITSSNDPTAFAEPAATPSNADELPSGDFKQGWLPEMPFHCSEAGSPMEAATPMSTSDAVALSPDQSSSDLCGTDSTTDGTLTSTAALPSVTYDMYTSFMSASPGMCDPHTLYSMAQKYLGADSQTAKTVAQLQSLSKAASTSGKRRVVSSRRQASWRTEAINGQQSSADLFYSQRSTSQACFSQAHIQSIPMQRCVAASLSKSTVHSRKARSSAP